MLALAGLVVVLVATTTSPAALHLGSVFSDHMVVQHGRPTAIWGRADAGQAVTVEINGQKLDLEADARGKWRGEIAALKAGGPYTVVVTAGGERREIADVLAGEVWLCSGQSNMAMPMRELPEDVAAREAAAANFPQIRAVRIPEAPADEPWDRTAADWKVCSPETVPGFSAEGYFFARKLHENLKTPVGMIICAWGGSSAHAWMSREALDEPSLRRQLPHDVLGWRVNARPNKLFCGMLSPIIGTTVRGVVWHQGETEGDPGQNPYLYRKTFPAMIQDWRKHWGEPELPFYYVQLFNLIRHERWPVVRESQAEALKLPPTGMTVTIDLAEGNQLHPKTKQAFGERMADLVLAREYGRSIGVESPQHKSMQAQGGEIRLAFDHASGLKTTDGKPPAEFVIAGEDQKFVPADAKIDGDAVIVTAASVSKPLAVRYAWSGNPKVNLVNADGLPAAPFRTDDWPVIGQEMMWRELPSRAILKSPIEAKQIVGGSGEGWRWAGDGVNPQELEKRNMLRPGEGRVQLVVSDRPPRDLPMPSPALAWAFGSAADRQSYDPAKGFTAEFKIQPYQFGAPVRGIELAVALKRPDGEVRRYRIEVAPMFVYGMNDNETLILGHNLNNCTAPHVYRIAVRPDGVAQVYLDDQEMGVLPGEALSGAAAAEAPLVSWGKRVTSGHMTVNVHSIAFDGEGAFAPGGGRDDGVTRR